MMKLVSKTIGNIRIDLEEAYISIQIKRQNRALSPIKINSILIVL